MATAKAHLDNGGEIESDGYTDVDNLISDFNTEYGTEYSLDEVTFVLDTTVFCADQNDVPATNVEDVIRLLDDVEDDEELEAAMIYYLDEVGYDVEDVDLRMLRKVDLYRGDAEDAAREEIDELYSLPSALDYYIDYKSYGEDMVSNGHWAEVDCNGRDYIIKNVGDL